MIMTATVRQTNFRNLLVVDSSTNQEVLVHFRDSHRFSLDDHITITFNGQMTRSIPPQITAISIQRITPPSQSIPTETRAVIIKKRQDSLLVRELNHNRRLIVHTPHTRHYCERQRIIIKYDRIVMNNPPEVTAIDIAPIC